MLSGALAATMLAACTGTSNPDSGRQTVKLWTHAAGNPDELATIQQIISDFNASQTQYQVVHEAFPQGAYNEAVTAAAAAGDLPCLIDVDGPIMPNWAWANYLAPLDLPQETVDKFLPSTVGRYKDKVYSIGFWDAAIAVYARKSVLETNGIRIPTMEEPWSQSEFDATLVKLKAAGFAYPLDLGTGGDPGEWWPYAYSPILQSFGGDLIDRGSYRSAEGALNGTDGVAFGQWWQSLFQRGLANPREAVDRVAFLQGKAALAWNGNWGANDAIKAFGDDVLFLPPPDFGAGPKIGGASWQWGITASCKQQQGALAYLKHSLSAKYLAAFSDKIGLIPATEEAAALTANYRPGGQYRIFAEYSRKYVVVRPPTPAYPVISSVFARAMRDITHGGDVKSRLDQAVDEIDANLKSNNNYGF
ncbi:MAG TPA: sugar-binding protein [Micromonosporaceae bacterium]|nr:sugar-binding protein [Micromonosporaceae bacterium]HCU52627.1 sugar-binding protein [Micromonosporaceae bacterium]